MRKIITLLVLTICINSYAQNYSGEVRAKDNSLTIGIIKRSSDNLKVLDSTNNAMLSTINTKLPSGLTVTSTRLLVDGSGVTQPVSIAATVSTNTAQIGGNTVNTGNGTAGTGTQRVVVASDQTAFGVNATQSGTWNVGTVTNLSQLGGQAVSMNTGVRDAGTQRVTIATNDVVPASQSGTWTVQPGNTPNTTPWLVSAIPATAGGLSVDSRTGLTNTVVSAKATAGQLYGYYWYNPNATAAYIQVFNTVSGSVTLGTTAPVYVITIPATSGANVEFTNGIAHSTAITYAATTTATGSTAMGSTLTGFMLYK